MRRRLPLFVSFVGLLAFAAVGLQEGATTVLETIHYDEASPSGRLSGGSLRTTEVLGSALGRRAPAPVQQLWNGPMLAGGRAVDLVFVGDGYTAGQLGTYQNHVDQQIAALFAEEPYSTYANYFTIHRVDVVSNESGVDNDPTLGVSRDTALDMAFFCNGIERLLCVNVAKAYSFANNAPLVDSVIALANSSKYGGAGYVTNDLATAAGANGLSTEIFLHELGHSFGDLADEYFTSGTTYTGGEPSAPNVSRLDSGAMASAGTKWHDWLGTVDSSFDGLQSTFEGGQYHQFGIYRPTNNSLMRSLGRPYNLPSVEAIVVEIYRLTSPIARSSDPQAVWTPADTLFVTPMSPAGHSLDVQWSLDGSPIAGATATTLDLSTLGLTTGQYVVSATVTDPTGFVRDPALRAQWLTETVDFDVSASCSPAPSTYCTGKLNSQLCVPTIAFSGVPSASSGQPFLIEATLVINNKNGLFFYGQDGPAANPFQGGTMCVKTPVRRTPIQGSGGNPPPNDCSGVFAFDFNAWIAAGSDPSLAVGQQINGQFWYRDPLTASNTGLSDGIELAICP